MSGAAARVAEDTREPGADRGPGRRLSGERGGATVEIAVALPAVVLVLIAVLLGASAGVAQLRCADAARAGARSAALGEDLGTVRTMAEVAAGEGAEVEVRVDGEWVTVVVTRTVANTFGWPLRVSAQASALREPGT